MKKNIRKKNIEEKLSDILIIEFEKYKRYKINSTFILLNTKNEIKLDNLQQNIRKVDTIIQLDDSLYFIIYFNTNLENGLKAAQNLLHKYEIINIFHISLDTFKTTDISFKNIINRLEEILSKIENLEHSEIAEESFLHDKHF